MKAVAPIGSEAVSVELPAEATEVSVLGEKLSGVRLDGGPADGGRVGSGSRPGGESTEDGEFGVDPTL